MPLSKLLLLFIAAIIIECSSTEFVSSLLPVTVDGIEPPDPLSPTSAPFVPRLSTENASSDLVHQIREARKPGQLSGILLDSNNYINSGLEIPTHPIVPLRIVAWGSSVGSQDSSRLIDKYSGSRPTNTLYHAPLTRVSKTPQRPPDIMVAVEAIFPKAMAPVEGVPKLFSIPDSTILISIVHSVY